MTNVLARRTEPPERPQRPSRFGELLRRWRTRRGMSQLALAAAVGTPSRHISFLETGRSRVHLQFRRFAGCPACNLHLRAFDRRLDQLTAAGIHEVVVFHSSAEALRRDLTETRFDVIADPSKELYVAHGVESSLWSILDPRAWGALAGGMLRGLATPPASGEGVLGLPADFLIAPDGRILACKYGTHADDQWSVDEVLALASPGRSTPRRVGVFYWIPTLAVALAFLGAGIGNLVLAPHIVDDLALLGYPPYFPLILGTWKVLGGLAIVVPRLPRLKEWAYAGIIFDLTGAAASRMFAGDPAVSVVIPLAIAALALVSWALRPANRRMFDNCSSSRSS